MSNRFSAKVRRFYRVSPRRCLGARCGGAFGRTRSVVEGWERLRTWEEAPWRTLDAHGLILWAFGLVFLGWLFRSVMSPLSYVLSMTGVLLFGAAYLMAFIGLPRPRSRRVRWRGRVVELPPEPNPWDKWREWWRRARQR
jgi:hypothetical protein